MKKNIKSSHSPNLAGGHRTVCVMAASMISILTGMAAQPKLLVGIVVDGLRQETLDMLMPYLPEGGFSRFIEEGVVYDNVEYSTNLDAVAATAMLMTGSSPRVNGISASTVYDPESRRTSAVFGDSRYNGVYATDTVSPAALKVTTVSDEARIAGAGVTYVYAIAPDALTAMVLGSHAGNSALWFNDKTGNWATSTFYGDIPQPAKNSNISHGLINRLDTMVWTPSAVTAQAAPVPNHLKLYPFRYTFAGKTADRLRKFVGSPLLNREITKLGCDYITALELGSHDGTDVLNLAYNLKPYQWTKTPENRYELYDSYVKLNESLAGLFRHIDEKVGRENAIIYLSATPGVPQRRRDDDKWNVPGGDFSSRKAVSLLNLYLIALHGPGEWIKAFHDGQFYLNTDLAKKQDVDINDLRRETAEFLVRMSGVGHAYTIDDVLTARPIVPNALGQSRNVVVEHAGDVMIDLIPGWTLIDDYNNVGVSTGDAYSISPTTAVFMISAPGLEPVRIDTPVDARAIAPALTGKLHIRSPNGAGTPPVAFTGGK